MSHFAFVAPPFFGHLNPLCVLARAVRDRGHRVTMLSFVDSEVAFRRAGLEFRSYGVSRFPAGECIRGTAWMGERVGDAAIIRSVAFARAHMQAGLAELPDLLRDLRPDGLITDQVSLGVSSIAEHLGLPLAVACCAVPLHREPSEMRRPLSFERPEEPGTGSPALGILGDLARFRRSVGLSLPRRDVRAEIPPSLVHVTQLPAFLELPGRRLPDLFHHTAPWYEPKVLGTESQGIESTFPWEALGSRPLIYASVGTIQNRVEDIYRTIAEACVGFDATLVVGLGRRDEAAQKDADRLQKELPGAPIVVPYAPQSRLLRRAHLLVTHAGLNTVLEASSHGVPMVCIPITNDQPRVSARLVHFGAAAEIRVEELSVAGLRAAISAVWSDPRYRAKSQAAAQRLAQLDGPGMASELVERALTERRRITSDRSLCASA